MLQLLALPTSTHAPKFKSMPYPYPRAGKKTSSSSGDHSHLSSPGRSSLAFNGDPLLPSHVPSSQGYTDEEFKMAMDASLSRRSVLGGLGRIESAAREDAARLRASGRQEMGQRIASQTSGMEERLRGISPGSDARGVIDLASMNNVGSPYGSRSATTSLVAPPLSMDERAALLQRERLLLHGARTSLLQRERELNSSLVSLRGDMLAGEPAGGVSSFTAGLHDRGLLAPDLLNDLPPSQVGSLYSTAPPSVMTSLEQDSAARRRALSCYYAAGGSHLEAVAATRPAGLLPSAAGPSPHDLLLAARARNSALLAESERLHLTQTAAAAAARRHPLPASALFSSRVPSEEEEAMMIGGYRNRSRGPSSPHLLEDPQLSEHSKIDPYRNLGITDHQSRIRNVFVRETGSTSPRSDHQDRNSSCTKKRRHEDSSNTSSISMLASQTLKLKHSKKKKTRILKKTDRRFTTKLGQRSLVANARNEGRQDTRSDTARVTGRDAIPLYLANDEDELSEYQCFLRQQIELFEADQEDLQWSAQKMNKPVVIGQVGLRCRHCVHNTDSWSRAKGSMYFSATLDGLYQAGQNMSRNHIFGSCQVIPTDIRQKLERLKDNKRRAGGGRLYWAEAAKALGIVEDEYGLRFKPVGAGGSSEEEAEAAQETRSSKNASKSQAEAHHSDGSSSGSSSSSSSEEEGGR